MSVRRPTLALEPGAATDALDALRSAGRRATDAVPVTAAGAGIGVFAGLSWYLAHRFGWSELSLLAATLVALLAIGLLFLVRRGSFAIELTTSGERTTVGADALGEVIVTNKGGVRSLPQRVDIPVGDLVVRFDTPTLPAGAAHAQAFRIPTERRGRVRVGPVAVVRADPLGLFHRAVGTSDPLDVWIHPRTVRIGSPARGWAQDIDAPTSDNNPQGDVAFHTIREYVTGDDLRHVHWRSSARMDRLMVRHYVDNRRPKMVVAIDTSRTAYADEEQFELALSAAASIEKRSFEVGCPVVHHLGATRVEAKQVSRLLDSLAEASLRGRGSIQVPVKGALSWDADATVGVVVTGSAGDPEALRRNVGRISARMRCAVVVVSPTRSGVSEQGRTIRMEVVSLEDFAKRWRAAGIQ